jgi:hypothetical protein
MSLKDKPHFTLSSDALASWIEHQPNTWWSVDGDKYLMSILDFPCPSDELAPAIRNVRKDVLIYDKTPGSNASGGKLDIDNLQALADTRNSKSRMAFLLSWGDSGDGWLLLEDEALVQTS